MPAAPESPANDSPTVAGRPLPFFWWCAVCQCRTAFGYEQLGRFAQHGWPVCCGEVVLACLQPHGENGEAGVRAAPPVPAGYNSPSSASEGRGPQSGSGRATVAESPRKGTRMARQVETRRFVARDESGAEVTIVAERAVNPGRENLRDPGEYQTEDGRRVLAGKEFGTYTMEADGSKLTTTDPAEPRDWA